MFGFSTRCLFFKCEETRDRTKSVPSVCSFLVFVSCWVVSRGVGTLEGGGRVGGPSTISRFFSFPRHIFHSFFPLLGVFSWNCVSSTPKSSQSGRCGYNSTEGRKLAGEGRKIKILGSGGGGEVWRRRVRQRKNTKKKKTETKHDLMDTEHNSDDLSDALSDVDLPFLHTGPRPRPI